MKFFQPVKIKDPIIVSEVIADVVILFLSLGVIFFIAALLR